MAERKGSILSRKTLNELESMIGRVDPNSIPPETRQWLSDSLDATEAYNELKQGGSQYRVGVSNSSIFGFISDLLGNRDTSRSNYSPEPEESTSRFSVIGKPIINIGKHRGRNKNNPTFTEGEYSEIE